MPNDVLATRSDGVLRIPKDGGPITILGTIDFDAGLRYPTSAAADTTHVYWIDSLSDSLWRSRVDQASAERIYDGPLSGGSSGIVVDDVAVYFSEPRRSRIMRMVKSP